MASYNIKLYAHGVPNGQDIWGDPGADAKYIETFYGRRSNVSSQLFVEVMQFNGETNSYYTYFRNGNVLEKGGRPGAYFALTIRINYYYADIQNIYNLLEASYNKYIVGTILQESKENCRFLVSQLNQADSTLRALEKEIEHYLMQFSSDADFISFGGFKCNGQEDFCTINLLEATPSVVLNHMKSKAKIAVSSLFPSAKEQQTINKMNADILTVKSNAEQQILAAQQKAKKDIETVQQKAAQDVYAAEKAKEESIQAVKNEYKDADRTIGQLRSQIDVANKQINTLNKDMKKVRDDLQGAQAYKSKYEKAQADLNKANQVIADVKQNLSGLSGIVELLDVSKVSKHYDDNDEDSRGTNLLTKIEKIHPLVDLILLVILVILVGWMFFSKGSSTKNSPDAELKAARDSVTMLKEQIISMEDEFGNVQNESDEDLFHGASIDVSDIDPDNGKNMRKGLKYTVTIKNGPAGVSGTWKCDNGSVSGNKIIPKDSGACTIQYIVNNKVEIERKLTVKP